MYGRDIGQPCELIPVELLVFLHVLRGDTQDKIEGTRHLKTFHHFGKLCDLVLECVERIGRVVVEQHVRKGDEPLRNLFSVEDSYDAPDIALLFQTACTVMYGGYGFVQFESDLLVC